MDELSTDNPVDLEPVVDAGANELETADNTDTEHVEVDDEGNPVAAVEDDGEDVEYDGKQYRLPKELKEALLRQQDYTRKTQEVAEARKEFEAQRQQAAQALQLHASTIQGQAALTNIDNQLQQYQALDMQALIDSDPVQALKIQHQYQSLLQQRSNVAAQITQAQQQAMQLQSEERSKQLQQGHEVLSREIKGWSKEVAQSLVDYGTRNGYQREELEQVYDPRAVKVLHKAMLYDQMMAKAGKPAGKAVEQAKPVTTVKAKTAGAAPTDPSKMTDAQFAAMRRAQIKRRNG